jgi:hypothetical protein
MLPSTSTTMTTETGKRDLKVQPIERPSSRNKRTLASALYVLAAAFIVSGVRVFQSPDIFVVREEETKPTKFPVAPFEEVVQQSGSTREVVHRVAKTREQQRGSWIGNNWVPPSGWRYYSATELRDFYRGTSVLWIGDSTARRAATSMYGILNTTNSSSSHVSLAAIDHSSVIDVNKGKLTEPCDRWTNHTHHPSLCRAMPGGGRGGSFILQEARCLKDLERFVSDELSGKSNITADVDIVIISFGIWEGIRPWDCREGNGNPRSMLARQNDTIPLLEKLQSTRRSVVWRTSGYMASGEKEDFIFEMNEKAMDQIEEITSGANTTSNLTYVDWGGAVRPRSFGKERINGDIKPHYGVEARHVLVQMITNQLASRRLGARLHTSIE